MAKKQKKKKIAPKKSTKKKSGKKPVKKSPKALAKASAAASKFSPGDKAPAFSVLDETGKAVTLAQFSGKPVVLYFYPKDDTPGCTKEACDIRDSWSRVQATGAVVLGVSKDSVASHVKFKQKFSLPYSLLADEDGKLCASYDVWKEKSMYGRKYMGIERTTFVIDRAGKIRKVFPKVKVEGHIDEILAALQGV